MSMICSAVRCCRERRAGYDRRHFHQLFRSPRSTTRAALWDPVQKVLGHGDNLLVKRRRVDLLQEFHHLVPLSPTASHRGSARTARCPRCAPRCAAVTLGWPHVPVVVHPVVLRACRPGEESSGPWRCSPPVEQSVWCVNSARAIATLRRSWRRNCLSRRCRLLMAAPGALSTAMFDSIKLFSQFAHTKKGLLLLLL